MARSAKEINDLLSMIDALLGCIENFPMFNLEVPFLGDGITINAMELLTMLLSKFYTKEEMVEWLANYLVYALPGLEIAIKGVILSNLKLDISCNVDPWIPDIWRQHIDNPSQDIQNQDENPCLIPISTIDYRNSLQINPTSIKGRDYYFDTKIEYFHPMVKKQVIAPSAKGETGSTIEYEIETFTSYSDALSALMAYRNTLPPEQVKKMLSLNPSQIQNSGDIDTIYDLCRANDMDAFLWLVLNKSRFVNPNITNTNNPPVLAVTDTFEPVEYKFVQSSGGTDFNSVEFYYTGDIAGVRKGDSSQPDSVKSTNYLLCTNGVRTFKNDGKSDEYAIDYHAKLMPCTNRANSYNWYTNRDYYFKILYSELKNKSSVKSAMSDMRDFSTEYPIYNLSCRDENGEVSVSPSVNSYFQLKVLPAPMLHYDDAFWLLETNRVASIIPFKRILFDVPISESEVKTETSSFDPLVPKASSKGRYTVQPVMIPGDTISPTKLRKVQKPYTDSVGNKIYNLQRVDGKFEYAGQILVQDEAAMKRNPSQSGILTRAVDVGKYVLVVTPDKQYRIQPINPESTKTQKGTNGVDYQVVKFLPAWTSDQIRDFRNYYLFPCYPGTTVYEFNYDFVMSVKLFDAKTIAYRIITTLLNCEIPLAFDGVSVTESMYQMRIAEIIKSVIESDAYEVSDCFFAFSNDKYASMLQDAEKKRAHQYPFADEKMGHGKISGDEIFAILNEVSSSSSKVEQTDAFTRAFTQASVSITDEILPEDKVHIGFGFILEAIKLLAKTLFECIITPKMLLLFEVNRRLMGDTGEKFPDIETLFKQLASLMMAIIKELVQTILAELLALVMKKIGELLGKLAAMLSMEQLMAYKNLIKKLIDACSFSFPLFGHRANLDTKLDVVQYADIDPIEEPKTDEC